MIIGEAPEHSKVFAEPHPALIVAPFLGALLRASNHLREPSPNLLVRTLLHCRAKVFTPNEKRCQELFGSDKIKA